MKIISVLSPKFMNNAPLMLMVTSMVSPKLACQAGRYGSGCSQTCSETCSGDNNACNQNDGACSQGCDPGYTGRVCQTGK